MQLTAQFSAIAENKAIDRSARVIRGVSVISAGEAAGHKLHIDESTLKQVVETASAYKGGLKVKFNHGTGIESIIGCLQNFIVDGDRVRADLHVLETAEDGDRVFELAEKMPDSFGLSISFSNTPEEIEGKRYARCAEIYSADLVDSPAANPSGLFSQPQHKEQKMSEPNTDTTPKPDPAVAELAAQVAELKKALEENKPTDLTKVTADIEAAKTELAKLTKAAEDAAAQAKKTEIAALIAEASRDGKVIPLTDEQLSKMDIDTIKEMIAKLPKAQVSLTKKVAAAPQSSEGKEIVRGTPEAVAFCRQKREEGAQELASMIRSQVNRN